MLLGGFSRLWAFSMIALVLTLAACAASVASVRTPLVPAGTGQTARGEQLYVANCQACHGGATGGSMMDIPPPHNANGHTWHHPDCQLVQTVLNGSGNMGNMMRRMMGAPEGSPRMPAFKGVLTEEDTLAILQYIKTWWTDDQRQFQAEATRRAC